MMGRLLHLIAYDLRRLWHLVIFQALVLGAGLVALEQRGERPGSPLL